MSKLRDRCDIYITYTVFCLQYKILCIFYESLAAMLWKRVVMCLTSGSLGQGVFTQTALLHEQVQEI